MIAGRGEDSMDCTQGHKWIVAASVKKPGEQLTASVRACVDPAVVGLKSITAHLHRTPDLTPHHMSIFRRQRSKGKGYSLGQIVLQTHIGKMHLPGLSYKAEGL